MFAAGLHLGLVALVVAVRVGYPFDIEWLEGGVLLHALRLHQGLPIYGPPSAAFIPFNYTPLEPWVVAAISRVLFVPIGYPLGRAVSIAASIGVCWAIFHATRREGGERWEAFCAMGVLAAGYASTGAWLDLVRVDSLYLALAAGGFVVLRSRGERPSGVVLGATLLALSFFAKQAASVFLAAGALALCFVRWRLVPLYLAVAGGLVGGGYAYLQWRSAGWFRRWVFEVPAGHAIEEQVLYGRAWERMRHDHWPILVLVAGAILIAARARPWRRDDWRGLAFWLTFGAAAVLSAALGAAIRLAYINAYLPALLAAAILAGAAAAVWRRTGRFGWQVAVPCLLLVQFARSAYDPRPLFPGDNRARAARLIARLRDTPGEVLIPAHPFAAAQAGKSPSFHAMALVAARHGGMGSPADLVAAVADQRYAAIVLHRPLPRDLELYRSYKLAEFLPEESRPRSLTGFDTEPRYLLVPKRAEPTAPNIVPLVDFESGSWDGWALAGDAFGPAPAGGPTRFQGPVGPFGGRYLANSGHPTPRAIGRAVSPEFEIPTPELHLRIGGGSSAALAARLIVGSAIVQSATGTNSDELRDVTWRVPSLVGRRARLELIDDDPASYLLVDDLEAR